MIAYRIDINRLKPQYRDEATTHLRDIIVKKHNQFDNFEMQDAHEFLQIFINIIQVIIRNYEKIIRNKKETF